MLCLTDDQQREFQEFQSQCSQLSEEYAQLTIQCNQKVLDSLTPYIRTDQVRVMQEFNK